MLSHPHCEICSILQDSGLHVLSFIHSFPSGKSAEYCKKCRCKIWPLLHMPCHLSCRIQRLQNGAKALMAPAWQAPSCAHHTQALTYSMQLRPATDTDAGSIAAADGAGSFTAAPVQRMVPSTVEAAQSSDQACCSSDEASSDRQISVNQLPDAKGSAPCGQMGQSERQMGPPEGQLDQLKLQPRSSGGLSDRQHGITSLSKTSALSKHSRKRLSNQQQQSPFRGVDATDHCSGHGGAGLHTRSDRLSEGSMTAGPDGQSPFGSMQQTGHGQADYPGPPLKVSVSRFLVACKPCCAAYLQAHFRGNAVFMYLLVHAMCRNVPHLCISWCMRDEDTSQAWILEAFCCTFYLQL